MDKQIIKMYLLGESALTIEKKMGIHYKQVYRILEKNNIKRRNNSEKTLNAVKQKRFNNKKQKKIARKLWLGKGNPRWKPIGSKRKSHDYTLIKIGDKEWIKEERYIMQNYLKRQLKLGEIIHHKNGNKSDNRITNLQVMTDKEHRILHLKDNIN